MSDAKQKPLRERITEKIAAAMEQGCMPWRQPWLNDPNSGHPCNFASKRRYNGINVIMMMLSSAVHDLKSKHWGTLGQWSQFGAYIKPKPADLEPGWTWGTVITFFSFVEDKREEANPKPKKPGGKEAKPKKRPMQKFFTVFNVDQVEPPKVELLAQKPIEQLNKLALKIVGRKFPERVKREHVAQLIHDAVHAKLEALRVTAHPEVVANTDPDFSPAEELIAATGAKITHKGDEAYYTKSKDTITMPPKTLFKNISHYYETLFHELVHWSVGARRLNLEREGPYAFNELVAEIGACYLAAEVGIPLAEEILPHSQQYIKMWLDRMGSDIKFIFDAAKIASKATDYLLVCLRGEEEQQGDVAERSVI